MNAPLFQDVAIPQAVYIIWAVLLAVVILVILPLAVYLLHRAYKAARNIERYFAEMAAAGVGIAENTGHIKALEDTIQVASTILSVAGNIHNHTSTIKATLAARANGSAGDGR